MLPAALIWPAQPPDQSATSQWLFLFLTYFHPLYTLSVSSDDKTTIWDEELRVETGFITKPLLVKKLIVSELWQWFMKSAKRIVVHLKWTVMISWVRMKKLRATHLLNHFGRVESTGDKLIKKLTSSVDPSFNKRTNWSGQWCHRIDATFTWLD